MSVIAKNKSHKDSVAQPDPARKFSTVEEAAQAKTNQAWETVLKHVDWNKLDSLRNQK